MLLSGLVAGALMLSRDTKGTPTDHAEAPAPPLQRLDHELAIPKGVRIEPPDGFTESGDDTAKFYKNANTNELIGISALSPGSIETLVTQWTKDTGFT